jgi:hypothetical protein
LSRWGFLGHEVVGRDADDDQAAVLVFLVEGFEAGVLRGESAFAGDVDEQDDFAAVTFQANLLAVDGSHGEVVDAFRLRGQADAGGAQHQDQN